MNTSLNSSNALEQTNEVSKVTSKINETKEELVNLFDNMVEEIQTYGLEVAKGLQKTELLVDRFFTKMHNLTRYVGEVKQMMFANQFEGDDVGQVYSAMQEVGDMLGEKMNTDGFFRNTFGDHVAHLLKGTKEVQYNLAVA